MADNKLILDRLERLEEKMDEKFDKMDARLSSIDVTLVRNDANIAYHIKRSDQLDAALNIISKKTEHIDKHVDTVKAVFKFSMWVAGSIVSIAGFLYLLKQLI